MLSTKSFCPFFAVDNFHAIFQTEFISHDDDIGDVWFALSSDDNYQQIIWSIIVDDIVFSFNLKVVFDEIDSM